MKHSLLIASVIFVGGFGLSSPRSFAQTSPVPTDSKFEVTAEAFADLQILRYQVPGFEELSLQQKKLAYYLSEAALSGRDIIYDQKGKYNLLVRKTLENIYSTYKGDKKSPDWQKFKTYAGQVWFSNGIHHHYSNDKISPAYSFDYFSRLVKNSDTTGLPIIKGESVSNFLTRIKPVIFDPSFLPKAVNLAPNIDNVVTSSNNF